MKTLQPFPLPSDRKRKITFREPTVGDSLDYCDINPDMEEEAATQYLNQLQSNQPVVHDAALWSAQDRLAALWWIFVNVSTNTALQYEYPCAHCGDEHHAVIDLVELDATYQELKGKKFIPAELVAAGRHHKITLHPIDGRGITHLQALNVERKEAIDAGLTGTIKRLDANIKMFELIHSFTLDKPAGADWDAQLEEKFTLICSMNKDRELAPLVARAELVQRQQRHGLLSHVNNGRLSLVSTPQLCPKAKEEGHATAFLLGFRITDFIAEI